MSKAVEECSNEHRLCHQDWIVDYGQVNAMLDRSYCALIVDDIIRVKPNSDPPCLILLIFKYSNPWCLCFESISLFIRGCGQGTATAYRQYPQLALCEAGRRAYLLSAAAHTRSQASVLLYNNPNTTTGLAEFVPRLFFNSIRRDSPGFSLGINTAIIHPHLIKQGLKKVDI